MEPNKQSYSIGGFPPNCGVSAETGVTTIFVPHPALLILGVREAKILEYVTLRLLHEYEYQSSGENNAFVSP